MADADAHRLGALQSVLDAHPDATVATIGRNGLFVAHPQDLDLRGRSHIPGRTAMEVVVPEDRVAIIMAWERALAEGKASVLVHLLTPAPAADGSLTTAHIHYADLTSSYGVFVGVLVPGARSESRDSSSANSPHAAPAPPRVARLIKNGFAIITGVDNNGVALFGYPRDEIIGRRSLELVHPDDHQAAIASWVEMLEYPGIARRSQLRHRRADGTWLWLEVTNTNHLDDPDDPCVHADVVDITAEMAAQEEVHRRERLLHQLAESLPLGVMQVDGSGAVRYTNQRLLTLLGQPAGIQLDQHLACVRSEHRQQLIAMAAAVMSQSINGDLEVEMAIGSEDCNDHPQVLHVGLRPLAQEGDKTDGIIISVSDVTEAVQMRRALEQRASVDVLTGCLNRAELIRRLESTLSDAVEGTAVVFVDMDGLKAINDTLGHRAGDEVLRELAQRLLGERRPGQLVGRLGGDEFLVTLPAVPDAPTAEAIGERIAFRVDEVLTLSDGASVHLRCSVGISWAAARATDAAVLVAEADAAMYASKKAGRGEAVSFRSLKLAAPVATSLATALPRAR